MTDDAPEAPADRFARWHDMGGRTAGLDDPAIDRSQHDYALWEKRIDALVILCGGRGVFTVDGLRRALEDMGEDAFNRLSYYERWCESLARNLIEAGVITPEELRDKTAAVAARGATYGEAADGA